MYNQSKTCLSNRLFKEQLSRNSTKLFEFQCSVSFVVFNDHVKTSSYRSSLRPMVIFSKLVIWVINFWTVRAFYEKNAHSWEFRGRNLDGWGLGNVSSNQSNHGVSSTIFKSIHVIDELDEWAVLIYWPGLDYFWLTLYFSCLSIKPIQLIRVLKIRWFLVLVLLIS